MSTDASVVCRWCVGGVSVDALADVLADASVGSDSLPLPNQSAVELSFTVNYQSLLIYTFH